MTEQIGRYEILEEIGQGGFAIVYRARDVELDRLVALKELRPVLLHDADWVRRFRREARTIARLDHPGIVPIYDVGEIDKRLFLVMRLVDGPGLDELINEQGCLPWSQAVEIITAVAEGLDYAHTQDILHRDLKPSNILLDPERGPMLSDFGLAKLAGESSMSATVGGGVVGTPHYIAPEVWEAKGSSPQSDIYALGCILYEMLTGEKMVKGETPPEVMMAHFKPFTLPQTWPEGVPSGVADVLKIALANKPADRYATASEMAEALAALTKAEFRPVESHRPSEKIVAPEGEGQSVESDVKQSQPKATHKVSARQPDNRSVEDLSFGQYVTPPSVTSIPVSGFTPQTSEIAMQSSSEKWRGFLAHLGPYVIIIGMLGLLNLFTSDNLWFHWPALGWGVGLAFHLMGIVLSEMKNVSAKWRGFARHFGSYAIIIGMLGLINLFASDNLWFHWPAMGWGAAVAIHLWATIFTEGSAEEVVEHHTATEHRKRRSRRARRRAEKETEVVNTTTQAHLQKARTYRDQIEALIRSTSNQHVRDRLQDLAVQVGEWTEAIEDLTRRVDRFERNAVIRQDLESVPRSIEKLEAQLGQETDAATRAELERTLTNRRNQLAALEHLQKTMKRAEIKIESTLSALGTIYSQILTSQSTNHVADYGRLSAEVDEEVRALQDHLEALEEVKLGGV